MDQQVTSCTSKFGVEDKGAEAGEELTVEAHAVLDVARTCLFCRKVHNSG